MTEYQAIIFDMNGVVIDDEHLHKRAEIKTCEHYGLEVPEAEWDNFRGRKSTEIFGHIANAYGAGKVSVDELVRYKSEAYFAISQDAELVEGVLEFIRWCRANFKYVALATSGLKIIQEFVFDKFQLDMYFDSVLTGDQVLNGKPDPEIYARTAELLGLPASQCMVVEDSDNGIRSGKAAGCFTLGITTSFRRGVLLRAGADQVFDSFVEMKKYLEG